mmetsp:Transcript_174863/g.560681  ORF Transcript_174863/g.560681 Transcript_174863/m.560681 type:complete len:503 (-) Transcript_174863:170-1678(-)
MFSPSGAMPSPVFTPAVLQNELPPWAHPTPSPSPMLRCPPEPTPSEPDGDYAGSTFAGQSGTDTPVPPDMLWEVCRPFIQQMLQALHQQMQFEIQAQVQREAARMQQGIGRGDRMSPLQPQQQAPEGPRRSLSSTSPLIPDSASAFPSLLNSALSSERLSRMGRPRSPDPMLREEEEFGEHPSSPEASSSAGHFGQSWSAPSNDRAHRGPQKVTSSSLPQAAGSSSSKGSSKGSSPNLQGPEPPTSTQSGTRQASSAHSVGAAAKSSASPNLQCPSAPTSSSWSALLSVESAQRAAAAAATSKPMYLTRQTPTVSPLVPNTAPSRLSPLMPTTEPQYNMMMEQGGRGGGDFCATLGSAASEGMEKSVMVCRHWKSKGWCKLGDDCKFLHPDHKRGSGVPQRKGGGGGGPGGSGQNAEEGVAMSPSGDGGGSENGHGGSRTRRAGRKNRRGLGVGAVASGPGGGSSQGSGTATAVAPGLVPTGPESNVGGGDRRCGDGSRGAS